MVVSRKLAFSVTADDCDWQTMTAGGPGGQHQNRSQTAVRVVHRASGAVGESREFKSQIQNKRAAFRRMAQSPTFREWVHERLRQLDGRPSVEEVVETMMQPHNLRVEVRGPDGWTIVP